MKQSTKSLPDIIQEFLKEQGKRVSAAFKKLPVEEQLEAKRKGGLARAANLTPERRKEIARNAGKANGKKKP